MWSIFRTHIHGRSDLEKNFWCNYASLYTWTVLHQEKIFPNYAILTYAKSKLPVSDSGSLSEHWQQSCWIWFSSCLMWIITLLPMVFAETLTHSYVQLPYYVWKILCPCSHLQPLDLSLSAPFCHDPWDGRRAVILISYLGLSTENNLFSVPWIVGDIRVSHHLSILLLFRIALTILCLLCFHINVMIFLYLWKMVLECLMKLHWIGRLLFVGWEFS